ncbi:MAG: cell division septation protein DedD [Saprospiraceae bacterium]|jgi:cell division septation protein DedD
MSKLDWFTILVIAICVLAIGALIWNAKNLYQETNRKPGATDISEDYTDTSVDDVNETYDINVDGDGDGDGDGDNGVNTNSTAGGGNAIQYDSDIAREAAEADAEEARMAEREAAAKGNGSESDRINTNTSPSSDNSGISTKSTSNSSSETRSTQVAKTSEGKFMVLIGSYTQMISAERMLRNVRSKGYRSAKIEKFNHGKYARVLVGRRKTLNNARDLQAELLDDGFRDIQIKEK